MRPEEWSQLREILDEALALEADRRTEFLDRRCEGQPPLRQAMSELLQAHNHASSILESWNPETSDATVLESGDGRCAPGTTIGHFRILEQIGEGAFGEVYKAQQTGDLVRTVALKVLRAGLDSRGVIGRFELERQLLTLVEDKKHFAEIYESGTTPSGRPYFAMAYVNGETITRHCDMHRAGIKERLALFAEVCDAIQHAHQKGIVHRDIKPSNILVEYQDGVPVPKIIDFGVAKALNRPHADHSVYTLAGQIVGTFAYMSPEQARLTAQDVDTRTDIYSLGVLLYELLTGLRPLDDETLRQAALDEILRMIREQEPARPSTKLTTGVHSIDTADCAHRRRSNLPSLTRLLRGDLDWITMCALEKDRGRRYKSASEFAADIRRYLAQEPISVGPPSVSYRVGKFVRRNRAGVIAAGLIAVVLLGAIVATTASYVNFRLVQKDSGRLQSRNLVEEAKLLIYQYPDQAWTLLEEAAAKDPNNEDAQIEMARVEWRRGDPAAARTRLEAVHDRNPKSGSAAALLAGLTAKDDPARSIEYRTLAEQRLEGAELNYALGIAEPDPGTAVNLFSEALHADPWMFTALWERAVRLSELGAGTKDPELAKRDLEAALQDADLAALVRSDLPMTHVLRGSVLLRLRQKENQRAARTIKAADKQENKKEAERLREDAAAASAKRIEGAIASLTRAIAIDADWIAHFNRGLAYVAADELEKALADFDAGLTFAPTEIRLLQERGWALLKLKRFSEAVEPLQSVIDVGGKTVDRLWDLADAYYNDGKMEEADALFTEIVGILPENRSDGLSYLLTDRGYARLQLERYSEAEADFRDALKVNETNSQTWVNLCQVLWRQGRYPESIEPCEKASDLDPGNALYKLQRGIAYWTNERYDDALNGVEAYLISGSEDTDWVRVWEWILRNRISQESAAGASLLGDVEIKNSTVSNLARYAKGKLHADDVLSSAQTDRDRFLATVLIGLRELSEGRTVGRTRLENALAMGFSGELESEIAKWALSRY